MRVSETSSTYSQQYSNSLIRCRQAYPDGRTTTMKPNTQSLSVSGTSTTKEGLPKFGDQVEGTTTASHIPVCATTHLGHRKSVDGRVPRAALSAQRERLDTVFRSRMQEARVELARDTLADAPQTLSMLRLSRGMSQQRLAEAIGSTQPYIARMEAGNVNLQWDTATRLADALGVKLDELRPILEASRSAKV